jgi:predicted aldo/keto reductase-like oxidoreductase
VRGGALAKLSPKAVAVLQKAAPGATPASWALRYAASLPNVLTVLSGMSSLEQLKDNVQTISAFKPLGQEEYATVAEALAAYRLSATIPCTACGYCMDCPAGVDIPKVFAVYNNHCTSKNDMIFTLESDVLGKDKLAARCVQCGKCLPLCPQGIKIPEWMDTIKDLTARLSAISLG